MMDIDITRLMANRPPKHYNNCQISDMDPLSKSAVPREIEVILPDADGSKVLAMWYGSPYVEVDDYIRIRRDNTDTNIYIVEGFGGGSGQADANLSTTTPNAGDVLVWDGSQWKPMGIVVYGGEVITYNGEVVYYG